MTENARADRALSQLLRVAQRRAEELQSRLADLETARASTVASREWLEQAVRTEEAAAAARGGDALVELTRYLEGAQEKRAALSATCSTLASEIDAARETLAEAFVEVKKLEHLLSLKAAAAGAEARAAGQAAADEAGALLHGRASALR